MKNILAVAFKMWRTAALRDRILFTLGIVLIFRLLAHVTVPGVDAGVVQEFFAGNAAGAILSIVTGGSLENFSLVMMGLAPYINASIIVQLMTVVLPRLEAWAKEGETGQRKLSRVTRILTVPLAVAQSYGMIWLISSGLPGTGQFLDPTDPAQILPAMITVTAGTMLLVWLGELITEKGIGNGISLLIFAGIIAAMPGVIGNLIEQSAVGNVEVVRAFTFFGIVTLVMLVAIVVVMEAFRPVPLVNAGRSVGGGKSTFPIRLLQAGMIPIIFAISLITLPSILAQFVSGAESAWLQDAAAWWTQHFNAGRITLEYLVLYAAMIILFTFFYVSIVFRPENIAKNFQKRGTFIPGVRPGTETVEYLRGVSFRINLWGGSILAAVALVPLLFTMFTPLSQHDLIISGSGLIIIVGVVLELIRQTRAHLVMHDYDRLG